MKISKTLVYFLIFTLVSSVVAYKLVLAGYEKLDYAQYEVLEG